VEGCRLGDDRHRDLPARRGVDEPAANRIADQLADLNRLALEESAVSRRALAAQAARDRAQAEFWSALRIVPWAFVKDSWVRIIAVGALAVALLQWSGVGPDAIAEIVSTFYCGDP
jgi:hypothetical protein